MHGAIYEFAEPDLRDARYEGRALASSRYRVFPSWAALLGAITALRFDDGTTLAARAP